MINSLEVFCENQKVGIARFSLRRGRVTTAFSYGDEWLGSTESFALDPSLPLVSGAHHTQGLPGSFRDSLPDRWGRNLIKKRLQQTGAGNRSLDDVDFLIGVSDLGRQGALRFRENAGSPFLADDDAVPPLVELPRLLVAAREVALGDAGKEAIKELLDAGSGSLGGARPKASVTDQGKLLLVKFPHPSDDWDVMAWEAVTLTLAKNAGIEVPPFKLVTIGENHVLLEERFDRSGKSRLPYLSAMSLCGAQDGDSRDYAEVADALVSFCKQPKQELLDLWRRVAFSCAVHNTDDHLRNLGFLRTGKDWHLAPLFDVNPNPYAASERASSIMGVHALKDENRALAEFGEYLGLTKGQMEETSQIIQSSIMHWRKIASHYGISLREMELFASVLDKK